MKRQRNRLTPNLETSWTRVSGIMLAPHEIPQTPNPSHSWLLIKWGYPAHKNMFKWLIVFCLIVATGTVLYSTSYLSWW